MGCCFSGPNAQNSGDAIYGQMTEDYIEFKAGVVAAEAHQFKKAIAHYEKAISLNKTNSEYFYNLANAIQEDMNMATGEEAGTIPAEQEARMEADIEKALKRAQKMYMEVIALDDQHHAAWYNLGYVQEELQLFDQAIKSFTEALKLEPNDKDAIINLGNTYMNSEKFQLSIEQYKKAIELDKTCVMSHYNLASAYHSLQNIQEAMKYFKMAIDLKSDYADAHFNLGICYQDEGARLKEAKTETKQMLEYYNKALEHYKTALRLDSEMEEADDAIKQLEEEVAAASQAHKV